MTLDRPPSALPPAGPALGLTPADLGFDQDPAQAWPEIALRFTLSQVGVHTAITGTTDPRHAEANIRAARHGPLLPAAVEALRRAFKEAEERSGTRWEGQT